VQSQLRRYRTTAGAATRFAEEWATSVLPLRERFGFRVRGWLTEEADEFVWLVEHDDRAAFEAAEAAYYASPDRAALDPDPARWVVEARQQWLTPVPTSGPDRE
jgi:hypothetical protein